MIRKLFRRKLFVASACVSALCLGASCAASGRSASAEDGAAADSAATPVFNADSAYRYVAAQVEMGPRVPGTAAHARAVEWLSSELRRHKAEVAHQRADLTAFDGTQLKAVNIIGQYNPEAGDRLLLLAHYDCRPWADEDPDPARARKPVDGANDGASGVGVLLETARQMALRNPGRGVDILFVDAEDWGSHEADDSWALGARYFANNPFRENYRPAQAVLLDMVGGRDARFYREYFSQQNAPELTERVWRAAEEAGYGHIFPNALGGAVTDDHVELQKVGIPAVDIIEYRPGEGFTPTWHTADDTMEHIDTASLKAVGETLMRIIYSD